MSSLRTNNVVPKTTPATQRRTHHHYNAYFGHVEIKEEGTPEEWSEEKGERHHGSSQPPSNGEAHQFQVSIVDDFSSKRIDMCITLAREGGRNAEGDIAILAPEVAFTLREVFFAFPLLPQTGGRDINTSAELAQVYAYIHSEEALYVLRRTTNAPANQQWSWTPVATLTNGGLKISSIPRPVSSNCGAAPGGYTDTKNITDAKELPHFESGWTHWEEWNKTRPSSIASHSLIACTQFSAFLVVKRRKMTSDEGGASGSMEVVVECLDKPTSKRCGLCIPIPGASAISKLCAGNDHLLLFDTSTGGVWTVGSGNHGELGHGGLESNWSGASRVEAFTMEGADQGVEHEEMPNIKVADIAAGGWHCLALTTDGDLYGWGWNRCGQLGYSCDEFSIQPTPYPFDINTRVVGVDARNEWTAAILEDGQIEMFGQKR